MYRLKQLIILAGDSGLYLAALYLSVIMRQRESSLYEYTLLVPHFGFLFLGIITLNFIFGLYDIGQFKNKTLYRKIIMAGACSTVIGIAYFYLYPTLHVTPKIILISTYTIAYIFFLGWRLIHSHTLSTTFGQLKTIFIGDDTALTDISEVITRNPSLGYSLVGWVKKNKEAPQSLSAYVAQGTIPDVVIIAPSIENDTTIINDLYTNVFYQFSTRPLADMYEQIMRKIPPFTFSESWFLVQLNEQRGKTYDRFRILIDYISALFLGLILCVSIPFVALAIKLDSPGPIFFKQQRVGRNNSLFTLYKFRSMKALTADGSAELNGPQFTTLNDNRITRVGRILRKFRLDELPQVINVFKGEMALIGPRPERPEFTKQLTEKIPFYPLRHLVKPGFTGWAQVQQSYYDTIDENLIKLEYDLYYVKNRGPLLDLAILLRTVGIVVGMKGR